MADNVVTNPGAGGETFATDDIGGVQYPRSKVGWGADGSYGDVSDANPLPIALTATPADYWPGYTASPQTGPQPVNIDPDGGLITRGSVLTDEGTFRVNFSNTSIGLSLGTVTVSGNTVTGTGFVNDRAKDVHYSDYFKLDADPESAWVQIETIDSDTQITLTASYVGGASGAASRALMRPVTGSGGTITVGSGACTLASGTTANATTMVRRTVDYAPLVYRAAFSISQRIANQDIFAGLSEEDVIADKWYARFRFNGTTNTAVICESARNPTTTPSGNEIQSTTVTLPNGLTTATSNEYRIEVLTERVVFYVNGVEVAQHSRIIPAQHDEMEAAVRITNGATPPASTTSVVIDYVTAKNHNKLEMGVMSESEKILASQVPLEEFSYSQAGVIAINTVLISIDCRQLRSLYIQCESMGTTGVVTPEWSNNPAGPWVTATLLSEAGATSTTFNAAVLRATNVRARYFRLRLSTATTAGTTTIRVAGSQVDVSPIVTTQPISGTVTANIGTGSIAAGTNRIANVAAAGIWFDDSSTALAANATFTGTSRDLTVTATATAFANAATYAQEVRLSAESDQSGTLWLEVSRDNTNWRRVKSVATAAVTGGGQYAEIVHRPSWRYARVGFTNGATLQTRFTIGSILMAV